MVRSNMWYRADLLFAQLPKEDKSTVKCESCNVLLEASSAIEVYDKAIRWAAAHVAKKGPKRNLRRGLNIFFDQGITAPF